MLYPCSVDLTLDIYNMEQNDSTTDTMTLEDMETLEETNEYVCTRFETKQEEDCSVSNQTTLADQEIKDAALELAAQMAANIADEKQKQIGLDAWLEQGGPERRARYQANKQVMAQALQTYPGLKFCNEQEWRCYCQYAAFVAFLPEEVKKFEVALTRQESNETTAFARGLLNNAEWFNTHLSSLHELIYRSAYKNDAQLADMCMRAEKAYCLMSSRLSDLPEEERKNLAPILGPTGTLTGLSDPEEVKKLEQELEIIHFVRDEKEHKLLLSLRTKNPRTHALAQYREEKQRIQEEAEAATLPAPPKPPKSSWRRKRDKRRGRDTVMYNTLQANQVDNMDSIVIHHQLSMLVHALFMVSHLAVGIKHCLKVHVDAIQQQFRTFKERQTELLKFIMSPEFPPAELRSMCHDYNHQRSSIITFFEEPRIKMLASQLLNHPVDAVRQVMTNEATQIEAPAVSSSVCEEEQMQ